MKYFTRALNAICVVLSMSLPGSLEAQSVFSKGLCPQLKTLQIIADDDFRKMPVIDMGGNSQLTISFDYLSDEQPWIDYTILHCNANWEPDDLSEMDYLEYSCLPLHVEDVNPSFNTYLPYFHYEVKFPNDEVKPIVSGNYLMAFHIQDEPDSVVAYACFMVSEQQAFVSGEVSANTDVDFHASHQQVNMEIVWSESKFPHIQPTEDLKVLVQQNHRKDNQRWIDHPSRLQSGKVVYEHEHQLIFEACNNWRRFEFSDERYPGIGVDHVRYHAPLYYAYLRKDKSRATENFRYDQDQHGRYKVYARHVDDMRIEAEYFYAMFSLEAPQHLDNQGVYLVGDLTNQVIDSTSRMEYDSETGLYHKELLLKEGSYNYLYLTPAKQGLSGACTEGNLYQTPNEYQIFVYYHPFGSRFDRLIGTAVLK